MPTTTVSILTALLAIAILSPFTAAYPQPTPTSSSPPNPLATLCSSIYPESARGALEGSPCAQTTQPGYVGLPGYLCSLNCWDVVSQDPPSFPNPQAGWCDCDCNCNCADITGHDLVGLQWHAMAPPSALRRSRLHVLASRDELERDHLWDWLTVPKLILFELAANFSGFSTEKAEAAAASTDPFCYRWGVQ